MICSHCMLDKSDNYFYRHPSIKPDGVRKKCTECRNIYRRKAHAANPDIKRTQSLNWDKNNRKRNADRQKRDRQNFPDRHKNYSLKNAFGITLDDFKILLEVQRGVCAVCEQKETHKHQNGKVKNLSVDHNHDTGEIRGLLCFHCNSAIGKFNDSVVLLQRAIDYLKKTHVEPME